MGGLTSVRHLLRGYSTALDAQNRRGNTGHVGTRRRTTA
jgi:hypothetical protein